MSVRKRAIVFLGVLSLVLFIHTETHGQSDVVIKPPGTTKKSFDIVLDANGWDVPSRADSESVSSQQWQHNGIEINSSTFRPTKTTDHEVILFTSNEKSELIQIKKYAELRSFSKLEAAGKTFAYILNYQQVGISESAGRGYFGPRIQIALVDDDGDGVFETRILHPRGEFDRYPDWIGRERLLPEVSSEEKQQFFERLDQYL